MSKLFVSDDEDEPMTNTGSESPTFIPQDHGEDEDPVVSEIPMIITSKPAQTQLCALQYPGRPSARHYENESHADVPIDTSKFFDVNKSDEWGGVNKQTLSGVLIGLEGYYVANVQNGEIVLCQLDKVAQLRPSLNYIDKEIATARDLHRLENNHSGRDTVQVVQMSVKSSNDNAPRLGEALMARKKVEDESFTQLPWADSSSEASLALKKEIFQADNRDVLRSNTNEEDYIGLLVKDISAN
ncbi:DNA-directed RNA polymerase III subunit RPC5 Short=RNA polymerase III subunit C5; AltName: Full=DNA-directed RNA polymerase III 37 kDa polypeptide; AltName: Full=RNA polymerase III subunit C37 [Cyberlindnera jadinii]|uniref:Uncharacterized protein n=1 Tax=Cyberlindnera jadinii (strain ATCC 18201 / CBS 1600 / BCRC 20928 / JCM 3617 / NBRC 0987 / NRRL Y-1542) TaxID=983966 RepID=A0A0H5BZU4_CYBJN|nr:DNA-directed RNA polymerase III subunit RPC5 Short=RNA polymerase III subunit C5; AltName: Full=DNA-directed RNA polymerase III 37 kDa polypeptide; AltName: Full=RNA polymerase III subunit C37 [Cyberlindnera jadinii]